MGLVISSVSAINIWSTPEVAELGTADPPSKSLVLDRSLFLDVAHLLVITYIANLVTLSAAMICSLSMEVVLGFSVTLPALLIWDWLLSLGVTIVFA